MEKNKGGYSTPLNENASISTLSTNSSTSSGTKHGRISDCSLDPHNGSLRCHLDITVDHWSATVMNDKGGNKRVCQIHHWACGHGTQKKENVVYCEECNVHLCTDGCYRIFHTKFDLKGDKDRIRDDYMENCCAAKK